MLDAALARAQLIPDREPLDSEFLPGLPDIGDLPIVLRARAGSAVLDLARRIALDRTGEQLTINVARHFDFNSDRLKSTIEVCA